MKMPETSAEMNRWLHRPLCRRYAAVVFGAISDVRLKTDADKGRTICWAFGSLINGDGEILGAWISDTQSGAATEVFGDLRSRGVESIRCGLGNFGDVADVFGATFQQSALHPSGELAFARAIGKVKPAHRSALASMLREVSGDRGAAPETVAAAEISSEKLRQKYPEVLDQWRETVARSQPLLALPEPYRRLVRLVDQTASGMQERLMKSIHQRGAFVDSAEAFAFVVEWLVRADRQLQRDVKAERAELDASGSQSGRFVPVMGSAVGTLAVA
ncbi:transposase [Roseateles cellulosilyticus]|uniref:Transposase n=1 Tax=Pelomonas cellulosilytica TaxID=2906762 RepID=A0ABS8Y430_9BURK|nr:transposase [Pelomonas sp. P8]MCE4558016.1 transposase [Pelomonas sp. P8]